MAQRRLGLRARVVERLEHALQRARQLGHLVIGLGMGDSPARVARSLDLARRGGQLGDGAHGPPRHREPGEQGQERSPGHAEDEEEANLAGRVAHVRQRTGVLEHGRTEGRHGDHARLDAVARDVGGLRVRQAEVGRALGLAQQDTVDRHDANRGVLGAAVDVEVGALAGRALPGPHDDPLAQVVGRLAYVVVEVRTDLAGREHPDDRREAEEDDHRERGRSAREPPADRHAAVGDEQASHPSGLRTRATRTPRRGSCGGGAARRPPRACAAGSRRRPRSCS